MDIKILRRTVLAIVLPFLLLLAPVAAAAEGGSVNIAVRDDVRTGNEFTVTVSFSADKEIGMVSGALAYSKSEMEFVSSDNAGTGGEGIVNISGSPPSGSESMDIMLHFRALSGGKSAITLTNGTILSPDGSVISGSLAAAADIAISGETRPPEPKESTVSEPDMSSSPADESSSLLDESSLPPESSSSEADSSSMIPNDGGKARLASITVTADKLPGEKPDEHPEVFKLKPDFSPDIFDYEVTVHNDTEYISVDAVMKDKIDTIWFDGSVYLAVGMTPWTITVTTPDGTVSHAYNLRVIRHEEGYVEESSPDESSSKAVVTTTTVAESGMAVNQAEPPKAPTESEPQTHVVRPLRERLMPLLVIAVCVIIAAVLFIVIRIRMRSKNQFGQKK